MIVVKSLISDKGLTIGKRYKVIDSYNDHIKIILDNGKVGIRNINDFEVVENTELEDLYNTLKRGGFL